MTDWGRNQLFVEARCLPDSCDFSVIGPGAVAQFAGKIIFWRADVTITIHLFAILRDKAGTARATIELSKGTRIIEANQKLVEMYPAIHPYLAKSAFAVNEQYVSPDTELKDGDQLALIPPVSGG